MKESKLFKSLVATFVIIVLGGPAVVLADTISYFEVGKASVSYADLNLESEEDVRVLYRRMQRASSDVCLGGSLWRSHIMKARQLGLIPQRPSRQCYREALSNAVDKLDNEDLTRIHAR